MTRFVCGGLTTYDLAYLVDDIPARGHKGTARTSYVDVGGPVANAAVTASILGSDADVHSVFGSGPFADQVRVLLAGYSVGVVDHGAGTDLPVASVWIDGSGERTILSTDNKRSEVRAQRYLIDLDGVDSILLDGHYPDLQIALAEAAVTASVPIVLDCGRWRPVFADLLPVASDVIMTATFRPPDLQGAPVEEAVAAICEENGTDICAASRGAAPIVVATESGLGEIPVAEVDVIDTTGAGDVLHGAYMHYRYGLGLDAIPALERAATVASNSCRGFGARHLTNPG
jgi:sugar/nucleoside kinase (ribokinase family)